MVTQRPLDYKVFFWSDDEADEEEGVLAWRKEAANRFGEGGGAQYAEEELRHTHVQQVCNVQFYVLSVATL